MIEYPKALYKDGDVHSGVFVIVENEEEERRVLADCDGAQEVVKRKPGRPKKDSDG